MKIPIITGPTATGKSDFALEVSKHLKIEIINADAFQVYKFMDIGTAKPSAVELKKCKHHLVDIITPDIQYNVGEFFAHCEKLIPDIMSRGRLPVIVGGTGLYVESLVKGLCQVSGRDENIYKRLSFECESVGLEKMYDKLSAVDPDYAQKISKNDKKRILRALEAYFVLGIPFSQMHKKYHKKLQYDFDVYVFNNDRDLLYEKINNRVDKMIEIGWLDEVNRLLSLGYDENSPGFKAIGYRELVGYLRYGGDFDMVVSDIKKKTRNFAKRQLTWFRHMEDVIFLNFSKIDRGTFLKQFVNAYISELSNN
ncbi:tRNA (adenosine(37)-N6)-dimethylallyltransferase MiaA [Deferribacteraceae bacterium V6Fe1]|nr:tRNA (adenosine(37)-N6)-dimethylallyltransferase MiaA [Deferribacteraceae bacterium V6Fe1]